MIYHGGIGGHTHHPYVHTCQYHQWSICLYDSPMRCVHESVSLSLFSCRAPPQCSASAAYLTFAQIYVLFPLDHPHPMLSHFAPRSKTGYPVSSLLMVGWPEGDAGGAKPVSPMINLASRGFTHAGTASITNDQLFRYPSPSLCFYCQHAKLVLLTLTALSMHINVFFCKFCQLTSRKGCMSAQEGHWTWYSLTA